MKKQHVTLSNFIKFLILTPLFFSFTSLGHEMLDSGIEVTASAVIEQVPDQFAVTFTITERLRSAQKAKQLVDHKSDLLVQQFKKLGIKNNRISSAKLTLYPIYSKKNGSIVVDSILVKNAADSSKNKVKVLPKSKRSSMQNVIFNVSRTITVKLNQLTDYDQLLTNAVKLGVSNISPVEMSLSNESELYQQALQQAVVLAKQKAQRIANQAGVTINKLAYIKEQSYFSPQHAMMSFNERALSGHQSMAGVKQIKAEVRARFSIH